jgi:peptidoglycan pentaglycine glycine transferase (the first glycine)
MPAVTPQAWDQFIANHPEAHLLQSRLWGDFKAEFGWQVRRMICGDAGAQVLLRRVAPGLQLAYLPKGPVGENWQPLWLELDRLCRSQRVIFLKVEPDCWQTGTDYSLAGFASSPQGVQPRRTLVVNLEGTEEAILARMKQKTRYNIRLAERKAVMVKPSSDLAGFHRMLQVTGVRDGFGVHSPGYYRRAYELFKPAGNCILLQAEVEGLPLAALMAFHYGEQAWYFYGASTDLERNRMPTYLLQWEAMRWAKGQGCCRYDLWGVPDEDEEKLEAQFEARSDDLWGVYRFKRGFGGQLRRTVGAYDRVYQPLLYQVYRLWLARRRGVTHGAA